RERIVNATIERSAVLSAGFDMLSVRTLSFGPGRNIKVKYSFLLSLLGFIDIIVLWEKLNNNQ
ncbi:MAG TPA: hypothetical protein VFG02_01345, partial [Nitrospirota bacterium]|nr:hypothetical protein [Nitrospirota bacterium]